ncbi:uncharacterized protein IWZ02DRAFT_120152 [Phyllosticta citriasiana]|uniref:Zn(2)-C6 fungal-type domain-containing protein n=1 Tax=Phyllosticta citriasiana TaxID=595635 RepID=A0ABR1KVM8_9PEZI
MEQTLATNQSLQPVKRVACNRCRTQKLKCNPSGEGRGSSSKCVRCAKAGTDCTFSPPKRVGRPRTARSSNQAEKRKKRANSEHQVSPSPEIKKQCGSDEDELDSQQMLPTERTDGLLGRPRPNPYHSGFDFSLESHDSWETVITPAADDPLLGSGPFCLDFDESSAAGSSDRSNLSPFHGDLSASDSSPTSTAATSDDMTPQDLPLRIDAHKRFMQELSELGISLYAEIHEVESFGAAVDDKFVSNVVHGAAKFLEMITAYQSAFSGDSVAEDGCHSNFDFPEAVSEHSMYMGANQTVSKPSAFELDTAGIFEVLTPYIRLVHLHSLMYTKFHEWLLSWPNNSAQANTVFPSLSIGNQSLGVSGKFQVELFLRLSLQILGEIEMRLGLPTESSVCGGYGTAAAHGEVLGSSVSPEVLRMALNILENGPGGMSAMSVRETLLQINQSLKGINS